MLLHFFEGDAVVIGYDFDTGRGISEGRRGSPYPRCCGYALLIQCQTVKDQLTMCSGPTNSNVAANAVPAVVPQARGLTRAYRNVDEFRTEQPASKFLRPIEQNRAPLMGRSDEERAICRPRP